MNKIIIALFLIFILIIFVRFYPKNYRNNFVIIDNKTFVVSIAKTDDEKAKGLSIYKNLPLNEGMVFPFNKTDYYAFWMKDMKFPIDIIYINNNKIVDIFENAQPPSTQNEQLPIYKPKQKANFVLEINAGLSQKYNFKKGDLVKINL